MKKDQTFLLETENKISPYGLTGGIINPPRQGVEPNFIDILIDKKKRQGWILVDKSRDSQVVIAKVDTDVDTL
jgi:hypothetical protein